MEMTTPVVIVVVMVAIAMAIIIRIELRGRAIEAGRLQPGSPGLISQLINRAGRWTRTVQDMQSESLVELRDRVKSLEGWSQGVDRELFLRDEKNVSLLEHRLSKVDAQMEELLEFVGAPPRVRQPDQLWGSSESREPPQNLGKTPQNSVSTARDSAGDSAKDSAAEALKILYEMRKSWSNASAKDRDQVIALLEKALPNSEVIS